MKLQYRAAHLALASIVNMINQFPCFKPFRKEALYIHSSGGIFIKRVFYLSMLSLYKLIHVNNASFYGICVPYPSINK